jgi:ParB family transcriptional regulator, chromosome partitioning protein
MPIIDIPLSRLTVSELNVRKTRSKEAIEQMAASIESLGLIQNLTVHEVDGNRYGAAIGGTRYEALKLLEKQGRSADCVLVTDDYPVPCDVRPADDPNLTAKSLAENFNRERMHPSDEAEAFASLASTGHGPIEIAARYGTTPRIVQQRQKLANISPKLKAIFRKGEMSLDQAQAFTLADGDHKRQDKVWRELPEYARQKRNGDFIRSAITEKHIAASSGIAQFVGVQNYRDAGGHVDQDLFADKDDEGDLTNPKVQFRLAEEKLAAAAATIRTEGWK